MPLLAYFGVVGTILVGLLFVAESQLGPPSSLSISTNFYGLPTAWKDASTPILTVRDAPTPKNLEIAVAQPAISEPPRHKTTEIARALKSKKTSKTLRNVDRNLFAESEITTKDHRVQ